MDITPTAQPVSPPPPPPPPAPPETTPAPARVTEVGLKADGAVVERISTNAAPSTLDMVSRTSIEFGFDRDLHRVTTDVVNVETEEVIRSIPNQDALAFAKRFNALVGEIFDIVA